MKACPHCRAEYEENLIYCTKDGSPLIDTEAPTADDIEIDTYIRKGEIPAVTPIDGLETQAWDADEVADAEYDTRDEAEVGDSYGEAANEDFADTFAGAEDDDDFGEEFEEEPVGIQKPIESEDKRSYVGLIVGALAVFGILILGTALVGGFLYYQSQNSAETASADANQESNSADDLQSEDTNGNLNVADNSNLDETDADGDILGDIYTTSGNRSDSDSGSNGAKDKDREKEKEKNSTTSTSSKNETKNKDSTKMSETIIERSTRAPAPNREKTAAPPRTPRETPTPARSIPSRISGGVVNGKAITLPVPAYPSAARSARVAGSVSVQVIISKTGSVMSARAVSGHPLLRSAAVSAAQRARFRPTLLSGEPVEVSGVIVYNFKP